MNRNEAAAEMEQAWQKEARWQGIRRPYSAADVVRLRGTVQIEYTLARRGAERLWELMQTRPFIRALGAVTGNQAVQMVHAGLQAIYLSGWQVAADGNTIGHTYPDQSLYPVDSAPELARRLNSALLRADQIAALQGREGVDYVVPIVADAESGFGGPLNTYELMKSMIEAGASGVHFEDQLSSAKKCGHMGGKVLVPASEFITKLSAARLAADVLGVPTVLIARTDADSATLLRSDIDSLDQPFLTGERSFEGFYYIKGGLDYAIARGLAYAPYADVVWCETAKPDLGEAREFAQAIHEKFPGKFLAYNCSPSFNWRRNLDEKTIATFQEKLGEMGYKFQFVTLAGFHTLNLSMFELANGYRDEGMAAYARVQEREFELEREHGYAAAKHQSFVGAGYFDEIQLILTQGQSSTTALSGSTEEAQFEAAPAD
ncbi:MAG: isocitrate lyase [Chloroflexi bacterium]|nr:isocitrate lyase [Chloroflexota bacterium]